MAIIVKKSTKTGGSSCHSSDKKELLKYLEDIYVTEMGKVDNIYVKKVCLQLKYLKENTSDQYKISDYLGNDEFSDSFLLDMYCELCAKDCFKVLLDLFQSNDEGISNVTKEKYTQIKSESIGSIIPSETDSNRTKGIQGPMDIRARVYNYYGDDKHSLGRDLFIVFSNINRDLWNTEPTKEDKVASFRNYALLASKVYTCCDDMLKSEFDIARDLTMYGNLLKSDVFKFSPKASFTSENVTLPIPATLPSPLDMRLYSLSGFINLPSSVSGGSSKYAYLLKDL